jgi:hypothetical protein
MGAIAHRLLGNGLRVSPRTTNPYGFPQPDNRQRENPVTNFSAATFGRIQSLAGSPRIMQFGVKYGF